ncbi:MAG TPA: ComEC/Rec2 family competence protein [Polyangia bacterium]|nr:ComEC/Rec2 family competence protein [Polyangia bacterium]
MRLVSWAVAFAVGDALAASGAASWRVTAAAALLAVALLGARRGRRLAGPILFLALGGLLGARAARVTPLEPALAAAVDSDDPHAIVAVVVHGPEETANGTRLVVALTALDGAPAGGTLALAVPNGWPDFGPGETIACRAKLRALRGTRNPGLPDPALALRAVGIEALAGVPTAGAIRRLAEPSGYGPRRAAYLARRALRGAIDRAVEGEAGAFLKTAVLGDRRGVAPEVEEGFRAAGATHVLSVSGLHLAAVAALFFLLVRGIAARVPRLPLYVDPRAIAAAASLPAIALFTLLTGEAVATERSALMLALGMGALLVGRTASPAPTIAGAALVLLIARPLQIFDVSLQLSVASVAGIALCARRLGPGTRRGDALGRRCLRWLGRFGAATLAATAATAPLCAHVFAEIAPMAPLGNLALVPLCEMVVVPVGLAGATAAAVWAPLGRWPLALAAVAARLTLAIAAEFRAHAPVWVCRAPNVLETLLLIAGGTLALIAPTARGGGRRLAVAAALTCAIVATSSLVIRDLRRRFSDTLTVTFLDVGQGDAAVVEAPGGAVMLIDGGGTRDGQFDTGARIVEPFLRARGISRLDVVALSHPHPDHLNGLFRVLQRFPVGAFWSSGDDGRNPEYRRLVALAQTRGVPIPEVAPTALGGARVEPLGPFLDERIGAPPGLTVNDASLVLRVLFAGRSVLFAGDLEADGEGELCGRRALGQAVRSDVLKVPHHGSRTSSSDELLEAVEPELAVMSLGWRNQFHFPAPEVLARYAAHGARTLRTDRDGAVTVTVAPGGALRVACERGCGDTQPGALGDR